VRGLAARYLPVMCDHILMTEGSGLFLFSLRGRRWCRRPIGQKKHQRRIWAAQKCTRQISGTVDFSRAGRRPRASRGIRALGRQKWAPTGAAPFQP